MMMFEHDATRIKEFESQVQIIDGGRVVKEHVVQVNSPLVYKGTKISQSGYDQKGNRWSQLGISHDNGVWFAYAGFLATMLGLMGQFYIKPITRQLRAGSRDEGDGDGVV